MGGFPGIQFVDDNHDDRADRRNPGLRDHGRQITGDILNQWAHWPILSPRNLHKRDDNELQRRTRVRWQHLPCVRSSLSPGRNTEGAYLSSPFAEEMNRCRAIVAEQAHWFHNPVFRVPP